MGKLFGTDGIRGIANTDPMTAEMALAIGRATAYVCAKEDRRRRIVIGKDTRLSGYMLESALTAGICSMGADVFLLGPMPTPGIAFSTHSMRADAGIVISASHNPYQDNGIKIFSRDGCKLTDNLEEEIQNLIETGKINDIRPTADKVGKAKRIDDAIGRYIVFCKNTFPDDQTLEGMKVVLDCANGATYKVAPIIFSELGAEVTALHNKPNGTNINDNCGSLHTAALSEEVRRQGADAGLAFDGDGDRLMVVDENGDELTGDHIVAMCAERLQRNNELENNLVVVTPMSNLGLRLAFDRLGINYVDAPVGDRNVLALMKERGAILGGEQSGHIIFLRHHTTGDGIISALQVLALMRETGHRLSKLAGIMTVAPQELINVEVSDKPDLDGVAEVRKAVSEAEQTLGEEGRVLVRYSGTQLMCRVMVEGKDQDTVKSLARSIAEAVNNAIG